MSIYSKYILNLVLSCVHTCRSTCTGVMIYSSHCALECVYTHALLVIVIGRRDVAHLAGPVCAMVCAQEVVKWRRLPVGT